MVDSIFPGIPSVASSQNLPPDLKIYLGAIRDNVELLNGSKGDIAKPWQAILRGDVGIGTVPELNMRRSSATGALNAVDHAQLVADFQLALQDIAVLRAIVAALVTQLKG